MKKIKLLTIILSIILIIMVAFVGIYEQKQNRMENKIEDYSYSMQLKGNRNVTLEVNTESKTIIKDAEGNEVADSENLTDEEIAQNGYVKEEIPNNSEGVLTTENYKTSKKVIEKRLKKLGVENYIIRLDDQTGKIVLQLEENNNTDYIVSNIGTVGKFEIIDSETNAVLMTNDDIKVSNVMYGQDSSNGTTVTGTLVYLNIEFTKEGAKKLEDISNKYVPAAETTTEEDNAESKVEETTEENVTEAETETDKKITLRIDDVEIMTTSFEEPIRTGSLQLTMGKSTTDEETLQNQVSQASSMATVLDTGNMPIQYEVTENQYIHSEITEKDMQILAYVILGIVIVGLIVLVIRYKVNGIFGAISYIGVLSIFILILKLRKLNIVLSIEGILGAIIVLIINYSFVNKLLNKLKEEKIKIAIKETYKHYIKIIPIYIMAIVLCFMNWLPISSFGMVMFWGISLIALYHIVVTYYLFKIKE